MAVDVYSGPGCIRCKLTIDRLTAKGVPVNVIDVSQDDTLRDKAIALANGQRELPIVDAGFLQWSGMNPDYINQVIERLGDT